MIVAALLALFLFCLTVRADKLSFDERMEIERGLTAEFATMKVILPQSKKPLVIKSDGTYDKSDWDETLRNNGPTARLGDQVQITKVEIEGKRIELEINGGTRIGHWYDHLQVGMAGSSPGVPSTPGAVNKDGQVAKGSYVVIQFPGSVPPLHADDIRRILSPVFDFDKHSATDLYVDRLPEPVKQAIKQQHAIAGMDKDQVLLAMGKPHHKSRETNDYGDEIEDWVYGEPPGKITFIRFSEGKVVKIEESYANIGGSTAPDLAPVH